MIVGCKMGKEKEQNHKRRRENVAWVGIKMTCIHWIGIRQKVTPVKGPYENTYISRLILDTECMYACVDV